MRDSRADRFTVVGKNEEVILLNLCPSTKLRVSDLSRLPHLLLLSGLLSYWIDVSSARAQVPAPTPSDYVLQLSDFGVHVGSDAIDLTSAGDGTGRVFVSTQSGEISVLDSTGASIGEFLDLKDTTASTGFINAINGNPTAPASFRGLMYFDFHPDYATSGADGFGKVYTGFQVNPTFDSTPSEAGLGVDYSSPIRNSSRNGYVIGEWSVDPLNLNQIDTSSFRQVMRFEMEGSNPHGVGEIAFNPSALPGDDDYGLLYAAIGDANSQGNSNPQPGYIQNLDNPFGAIIRINPLQNGADPYSVPASNPFDNGGPLLDDDGIAEEIYAYGFRDPQTFSFAKDGNGVTVLITFDIGASDREEIDLVRSGGNYGWERFEGTALLNPSRDLVEGSVHSPPVVEYDHATGGFAIIGGFLVSEPGNPNFQNKVVFSDLPTGKAFFADYEEMLQAEQSGTQATVFEMDVALNDTQGSFEDIFSANRGDARFGVDENDRLFIVSKQTNQVLLTNLVASSVAFSADVELVVDIDSGAATIIGIQGATTNLRGYSLLSASGALNELRWGSLQDNPAHSGWQIANATAEALNELNATGSTLVDAAGLSLGNPVDVPEAPAFGVPASATDTRFEYVTGEGEVLRGFVRHEGLTIVNNLLLKVDPESGQAELMNSSQTTIVLRGYSILSESESLKPNNGDWNSLSDQLVEGFQEANPSASALTELAPLVVEGITLLPGQTYQLGALFDVLGDQDLQLEFVYSELPSPTGDYNNDGIVDGADYTLWRDSLGGDGSQLANRDPSGTGDVGATDYAAWKNNFGATSTPGSLTAGNGVVRYTTVQNAVIADDLSVPEPGAMVLAVLSILACAGCRRRRRSIWSK